MNFTINEILKVRSADDNIIIYNNSNWIWMCITYTTRRLTRV